MADDHVRHANGEQQSYSARWRTLAAEAGIAVKTVDVFAHDVTRQVAGCDGFMWRPAMVPLNNRLSQQLTPAIETGLGIPVFPSWRTQWHARSKTTQKYLLEAAGVPTARTWLFWRLDEAIAFCRSATYPLVMKLSAGAQSDGVQLLRSADEAVHWARRMFGVGATQLTPQPALKRALAPQVQGLKLLLGRPVPEGLEHGYLYLQEFLPDNPFDTRVTVIGDRAFAFRRFNRPDDFRASGSGRIDWDPAAIDPGFLRLAVATARALGTQTVCLDLLYRGTERIVCETGYTYASWAVRDCPGHWRLHGAPGSGELEWRDGRLDPADAIFADFVDEVRARTADRRQALGDRRLARPALG
jgi:hypothetical protein